MTAGQPFSLLHDAGTGVLAVRGDIEATDLSSLHVAIAESRHPGAALAIDLTEVTYLPSLAVSALVAELRRAADDRGTLVLRTAADTIAGRVLDLCGVSYELAGPRLDTGSRWPGREPVA